MSSCERCGKVEPAVTTMSWFNTDTICMDCSKQEETHPDFEWARALEQKHVARGNLHFEGVGWPGMGNRVSRPSQA